MSVTRADTSFSVRPDVVTTSQIATLSPEDGRIIYDKTVNKLKTYNGTSWVTIEAQTDIFSGGFADYNDLATQSTPLVVTVAGSPVSLTNDGLGAFTNKTYLPTGVTDVWDTSTNMFDWSDLSLGDMVDIRLDIDLITASPNTEIKVDLHLGTGGGAYTIPFITDKDFKNVGTHKENRFNGIYMGDANTLNNGGQFMITTDKDCTVKVNGWYVKIIQRG